MALAEIDSSLDMFRCKSPLWRSILARLDHGTAFMVHSINMGLHSIHLINVHPFQLRTRELEDEFNCYSIRLPLEDSRACVPLAFLAGGW